LLLKILSHFAEKEINHYMLITFMDSIQVIMVFLPNISMSRNILKSIVKNVFDFNAKSVEF